MIAIEDDVFADPDYSLLLTGSDVCIHASRYLYSAFKKFTMAEVLLLRLEFMGRKAKALTSRLTRIKSTSIPPRTVPLAMYFQRLRYVIVCMNYEIIQYSVVSVGLPSFV